MEIIGTTVELDDRCWFEDSIREGKRFSNLCGLGRNRGAEETLLHCVLGADQTVWRPGGSMYL